jgi:hypothetical protein
MLDACCLLCLLTGTVGATMSFLSIDGINPAALGAAQRHVREHERERERPERCDGKHLAAHKNQHVTTSSDLPGPSVTTQKQVTAPIE